MKRRAALVIEAFYISDGLLLADSPFRHDIEAGIEDGEGGRG
jgi:hypothetical protein